MSATQPPTPFGPPRRVRLARCAGGNGDRHRHIGLTGRGEEPTHQVYEVRCEQRIERRLRQAEWPSFYHLDVDEPHPLQFVDEDTLRQGT